MFRGQRIEISNTVNSMKYDGYRYSVITKMEPSDYTIEQDPINFKTIINEKWKFIVTIITIRTSSYRFPNGRLSYTDLYTLDNSNTISIINGSADSLLQSYRNIAPNDQKLSDKLDFYSSDADSVYSIISNNDSFIVDLQEEILLNANGRYNSIYVVDPYSVAITEEVKNVEKNTVELSSHVLHAYFTPTTYSTLLPSSLPWSRYLFFHQDGGNDALLGLRDRLSFTEISKVITNDSARKSTMEYEILKSDFSLTTTVEDGLLFKMISPEQLIRTYDYIPTMDFNKPHSFFTSDTIGAVLTQIKNLQTLYRYQGNFSPKFRDILKFQIREDNDFTSVMSTDFLKCNTHLGTTLSNFSILKNEYFNKVSSSEILTISTNEGFQPVYPLVDEISIDKKDSYAWSSNWDKNYYRYYDSTSSYTGAIGTSSMKEIKSMFGSKCMKVPKAFDLYEFKTSKVTNLSELTSNELTYIDYGDKCLIHVNVYDRLLREMLGDSVDLKAKTEFLNAMNIIPETFTLSEIDAKTTEYLIQNIMSLYEIQDVKLYILQTGVSDTGHIATIQNIPRPVIETVNGLSLTETSLLSKEYLERKNAKLLNKGNIIIEIDYPFDSRYYTSLSLGVSIKRI